jgi:hypothetical protein
MRPALRFLWGISVLAVDGILQGLTHYQTLAFLQTGFPGAYSIISGRAFTVVLLGVALAFIVTGVVEMRKLNKRKSIAGRNPTVDIRTETHGNNSPIAGRDVVQNFGITPTRATAGRPWIRPYGFGQTNWGEEALLGGHKEFIRLNNTGDDAYNINIQALCLGPWTVLFEPSGLIKSGASMRLNIHSIRKEDGSSCRKLDLAWPDRNTGDIALVRVEYEDANNTPFACVGVIERDHMIGGGIPFKVTNCSDG